MRKPFLLRKLFLTLLLSFTGLTVCRAELEIFDRKLDQKISAASAATYFDLVKKVFPDATRDERRREIVRAKAKIPLRNLFLAEPPDFYGSSMQGELTIGVADAVETLDGREKILWVMFGVIESGAEECDFCGNRVLAAYRVRRRDAELIDAASVKSDVFTSFSAPRRLPLAARREAVVIYNGIQISKGRNVYSIIAAGKNGFQILLEFAEQQIYQCGSFFQEEARIRALKTFSAGYRRLEIIVKAENGWETNNGGGTFTENRRRFRYVFAFEARTQSFRAVVNPDRQRDAFLRKHGGCGAVEWLIKSD